MSDECYYCGDIEANFYHIECARKMSEFNSAQYKNTVLTLQSQIKSLEKIKDAAVTYIESGMHEPLYSALAQHNIEGESRQAKRRKDKDEAW